MENASKALLIAASVLIVILLIAFGISIFRSGQGTGDALEVTMDATEKGLFNSKFTSYCGTSKSAAQAKALANAVVSSNATDSEHQVSITIKEDSSTIGEFTTSLAITNNCASISGQCKIEIGNISDDGYITNIIITKK